MIRRALPADARACVDIYNYYIENTIVTLETAPLSEEAFAERIRTISAAYPYFVWEDDETHAVGGYAYLSAFSPRGAYRFTCDVSIYLDKDLRGRGIGHQLMDAVTDAGRAMGLHTVLAVVTSENEPSMRFHTREGFAFESRLEHLAYKMGRWMGICYYRKDLFPRTDAEPEELKAQ